MRSRACAFFACIYKYIDGRALVADVQRNAGLKKKVARYEDAPATAHNLIARGEISNFHGSNFPATTTETTGKFQQAKRTAG